ncbi:hypothetical protein [Aliidiomarina indica]|uniref:hypothetical protein n=1 Tax=Aliidiomarina indica TaxID=2749147 RepID=UPI00188E58FE|nr:hypothetical protein [Aliidiomarina indica]
MKPSQGGQAFIELSVVISTTGILLVLFLPPIHQALQERYVDAQRLQIELAEAPLRKRFQLPARDETWWREHNLEPSQGRLKTLSNDADYPFAQGISPVWSLFAWQSEFSLPLDTAYTATLSGLDNEGLANGEVYLQFRRIHHDWSPEHVTQLSGRPRSLTATAALHDLGFHYVQQVVSWLPFAREFAPNQLQLGYVNSLVVPKDRTCRGTEC